MVSLFFDYLPAGFICGHRGARSIAPENTLLSMALARESGAHCIETDVRLSKDGKPVIFHDNTLTRTTDIANRQQFRNLYPWKTEQLTAAELRRLDCGSWFLRDDPFGTVNSGEVNQEQYAFIQQQKIPQLVDLLEFSRKNGFPVNLEIKDAGTPLGNTEIVDRVLEILTSTGTGELVLLSSFRDEYLRRVKALNPNIPIAVLAEKQHPPDLLKYLADFPAAAYHPHKKLCSRDLICDLQQAGFRVTCWTINDAERARQLRQSGVGVITDWPQRLTGGLP